jgi:hypothetical protein
MPRLAWKGAIPIVGLLAVLLLTGPMAADANAKGAGLRERARQAAAKMRSVTRGAVDRSRGAATKAKDAWQRRAPEARRQIQTFAQKSSEALHKTRDRATRFVEATRRGVDNFRQDTMPRMKEWGRRSRERLSGAMERLDPAKARAALGVIREAFAEHGPLIQARIMDLYATGRERLIPQMKQLAKQYGTRVLDSVRDPELRARTMDGLAAAIEIHDMVHGLHDHVVATALDTIGDIEITVGGRTGTIDQLGGAFITAKLPFLKDTPFTKEPVKAIAMTFVMGKPDYLLDSIPVPVSAGGNARSISDVLATTSSTDVDNILVTMDLASNVLALRSSLRSRKGIPMAALNLTASLNSYRNR